MEPGDPPGTFEGLFLEDHRVRVTLPQFRHADLTDSLVGDLVSLPFLYTVDITPLRDWLLEVMKLELYC